MKNIIFIFGLAGAGKTSLASALVPKLEEKIKSNNLPSKGVVYVDGDEFREVFNGNFGYSKEERIRCMLPKLKLWIALAKQGFTVVTTGIGLFNECYEMNKKFTKEAKLEFFECYLKCDFEILLKRDQKCLYSDALEGKRKDVVGVDIDFDEPKEVDLVLDGSDEIEKNVEIILSKIN